MLTILIEFRSMRDYDREAFLFDLQNVDWEMAASAAWDDPNVMASNFYDLFHSILDVHAPLKTRKGITRHTPSPWITPRIKNLIRERDRAKKKARSFNMAERDRSIWPEYKRLRNRVTSELRRAVEGHFRSLIDENSSNPKEMWKTINKVLNKNQCSTVPRSVMCEGQLVEKEKEIAEALNNHFTTIGPKLAAKIETKESDDSLKYVIDEGPSTAPPFEFHPVEPSTIEKEIMKLKCSKSAGYDKVSVKLVKDAAGFYHSINQCKPLAAIFNSSFEMGVFPKGAVIKNETEGAEEISKFTVKLCSPM